MEEAKEREKLTLVTRKSCFGLPTSCPNCLSVYAYLKFSNTLFDLDFNLINPDSDQIPYVEYGTYVAYNNEKGGVIRSLIEDGFVDLDSQVRGIPEWISAKAMVDSWLADAIIYELWVGSDGTSAHKIYYSDLPWPLGKILYLKQVHVVKQILGITKENAERREEEIYRNANDAFSALSKSLFTPLSLYRSNHHVVDQKKKPQPPPRRSSWLVKRRSSRDPSPASSLVSPISSRDSSRRNHQELPPTSLPTGHCSSVDSLSVTLKVSRKRFGSVRIGDTWNSICQACD